jgi:hypothetical protein
MSGQANLLGVRISCTERYSPEALTPRTPRTCPGKREKDGIEERFSETLAPAPRRRDVSRTKLVGVGREIVLGGSRQIRPNATISFYVQLEDVVGGRVQVMDGRG